ncbi:hypothetical protein [Trichloromonas sp.]|uniref:hypothetical protein n=1 Tax=Trichloromonas sp. TaxID=3069249 RepID=UPI003D8145AF
MKTPCYTALKKLAYWGLPRGVYQLLEQLRDHRAPDQRASLNSQVAHLAKDNTVFKDQHKGERCFILATGPSVAQQDLRSLADEHCIAVSHFFLHRDIRVISPQYHVVAPYHSPFTFAEVEKLVDGMHENYSKNTICFFCHAPYQYSTYEFFRLHPEKSFQDTYLIDYTHSSDLNEQNHLRQSTWDIAASPFQVRTVIYAAIQLAFYMGFKEVYLVGCDHDYLHDTKRVSDHHFYKEEEGVSDVEHLSGFTTERWFKEYYFRWQQYRLMQEYAKQRGCQILNATKGGMLDVFPRVSLEDILNS